MYYTCLLTISDFTDFQSCSPAVWGFQATGAACGSPDSSGIGGRVSNISSPLHFSVKIRGLKLEGRQFKTPGIDEHVRFLLLCVCLWRKFTLTSCVATRTRSKGNSPQ